MPINFIPVAVGKSSCTGRSTCCLSVHFQIASFFQGKEEHVACPRLQMESKSLKRGGQPCLCFLLLPAAAGFGRGAAHAVFFFLSIATPTLGAATLYLDVCPAIPFFLIVGASWPPFCLSSPFEHPSSTGDLVPCRASLLLLSLVHCLPLPASAPPVRAVNPLYGPPLHAMQPCYRRHSV